ncbi:MAG: hypothetical protein KKD01_06825 [Proteobacteria bacterium]|nr:hypothetical protein [Pseudomonadota bacterium]MBU1137394.1 hypothetical protein [Pseudomonadota bacterium]MBU1233006.1 hypothetical protein [Pseudomonadota bacterium]MBU1418680.1 hypothetical protein [Pseudomonadota bacterium]MBU1454426.1 hypothetical protein [Pseudomonadota bacterium]
MLTTLLVCKKPSIFKQVKDCLIRYGNTTILEAETVDVALQIVKEIHVDLVIAAEQLGAMSGIEFINNLIHVNALINTALVSGLPPEDFHYETEGLGILKQLPVKPQESDIEDLLQKIEEIANLLISPQGKEVTV